MNTILKAIAVILVAAYIVIRYQTESQLIQSAHNSVDRDMKYIESLRD